MTFPWGRKEEEEEKEENEKVKENEERGGQEWSQTG